MVKSQYAYLQSTLKARERAKGGVRGEAIWWRGGALARRGDVAERGRAEGAASARAASWRPRAHNSLREQRCLTSQLGARERREAGARAGEEGERAPTRVAHAGAGLRAAAAPQLARRGEWREEGQRMRGTYSQHPGS